MEAHLDAAHALAADLAGASVDPNEAQKALAYLRGQRDSKQFFGYLRAVVADGRAVIRSGQTLGYYRELLAASERHLRGMDPGAMAQTLGWAIRLLRYYRAVPDAGELIAGERAAPPAQAAEPAREPAPRTPKAREVGDVFAGRVLELDDAAVVIEVPGFDKAQSVALMRLPAGQRPSYQVGGTARVQVQVIKIRKSGLVVLEVVPAAKRER